MDERLTSAEGFPCAGQLSTGEVLHGLLILRYSRQSIPGYPRPVGTGMERWCDLTVEGTAPASRDAIDAMVVSERLGERLQIRVTPDSITPGTGTWRVQGPYELRNRWKLPGFESSDR